MTIQIEAGPLSLRSTATVTSLYNDGTYNDGFWAGLGGLSVAHLAATFDATPLAARWAATTLTEQP